jgi:hypothetical protein
LLREATNRELKTYVEFFKQSWNLPDRSDHYMMQIAQALSSDKKPLDDLKIGFNFVLKQPQKPVTEAQVKAHQAIWFARLGFKRKKNGR